jgi:hypothetical protein
MKTGLWMAAAGLLGLAACGSGEDAPAKIDAAAAANIRLQPGQWELVQETVRVSAPGMPPGAAEMMKMPPVVVRTCIAPAEAGKPGPDLFSGNKDPGCKTEGFSAKAGRVAGTMTCRSGAGETTVTKLEGDFTAEEFEVRLAARTEGGGSEAVDTEMRSRGRRTGECPAGVAG